MGGQLYTGNTWRSASGATVLQTSGVVTQEGDQAPTGTLFLRGATWSITGIADKITFGEGPLIRTAAVEAHGTFVQGLQRIPARISASFADSRVTVDTCSYTVRDLSGRVLATGNLLMRNAAGDYWVIEYAALEMEA